MRETMTGPEFAPAEVFRPGEFIGEELEVRGWSQRDLAEIMGCSPRLVNEIIRGKRAITPETARRLGAAFGTSAALWLNLENAWRLRRLESNDEPVRRRARLYELAPVKELIRRGWIRAARDIDELESEICRFFAIDRIDEEPVLLPHAARKSAGLASLTAAQRAWLFRVKQLGAIVPAGEFGAEALQDALDEIRSLLPDPEAPARVSDILARAGVRFLIVEHLTGTRIDGACLWLDERRPVVALSLRYGRIDWFWHTLLHELAHVKFRDGLQRSLLPDVDLVGPGAEPGEVRANVERRADRFASEFLIPHRAVKRFIEKTAPYFSKKKICEFAGRMGVHPGIVVGRLQYLEAIPYRQHRKMLVPVRDKVLATAFTDGWGRAVGPVGSDQETRAAPVRR